ncbi:MAG TPA: hypothetical protein VM820_07110 [Vicinamibacterales bacterium]|nr:hypothetical protein [Vicinamibacterales bacterium]
MAAEREEWERQQPAPPRRVYVETETVRVTDRGDLQRAIKQCIRDNDGGIFGAGLVPDPQVTADGLGANINFFREE